jgi:hypothetical protein
MAIRVVPNETVPPAVYRVLLPHERRVITVRTHPAALFLPLLAGLGGLVAAAVLTGIGLSPTALTLTWTAWGLAFVYLVLRTVGWWNNFFVLTAIRLILLKGFLGNDVEMLPLWKATKVRLQRPLLGRLLGYGRFTFETVGAERDFRTVNYLPYPEQLYIEVCGLIFRDPGTHVGRGPEPTVDDD